MSTPSETIRTETSQRRSEEANSAMRRLAPGSSLITSSGRSPATDSSRAAIARA